MARPSGTQPGTARPAHLAALTACVPELLRSTHLLPPGSLYAALQKPITFFRQVLSLCEYPELINHPAAADIYPPDAIAVSVPRPPPARAQNNLTALPVSLHGSALVFGKVAGCEAWCTLGPAGWGEPAPLLSCTLQWAPAALLAPLQRAREYLDKIPGGVGAYSESKGATILRQASPCCPALPACLARCSLAHARPPARSCTMAAASGRMPSGRMQVPARRSLFDTAPSQPL